MINFFLFVVEIKRNGKKIKARYYGEIVVYGVGIRVFLRVGLEYRERFTSLMEVLEG